MQFQVISRNKIDTFLLPENAMDQNKVQSSRKLNDLLISAISTNDLELVKKCVEQGADVDADWPLGYHSVFTKAVENGNIDIVRCLMGKRLKKRAKHTYSPLIVAIRSNFSLELVKFLIDNGADVDETDISGRIPLNEAIALNKDSVVEYLLMSGADVDQSDNFGRLPIVLAVKNNRLEIVKLLTRRGADINRRDSKNEDALTLARRLPDSSIVDYLERTLQKNENQVFNFLGNLTVVNGIVEEENPLYSNLFDDFDIVKGVVEEPETISFVRTLSSNTSASEKVEDRRQSTNKAKDEDPSTNLLDLAISEDDLEKVKTFLHDKNINEPDELGSTPLAKAISFGETKIVDYLVSSKADTCKKVNGKTPLLLAVEKENLEIIQILLEHGAEHTMQTAFFQAINLGHLEIVKYFIQKGVELNVIYRNGYTPLTKSLELRNFDIAKELVKNGANVNMPDGNKNLPLAMFLEADDPEYISSMSNKAAPSVTCSLLKKYVEYGNLKMVKILVEDLKVNADCIFDCGSTALTNAVELQDLEMVEYLVSCKATAVNKVDGNNKTPLGIAAKKQNLLMVKFLIKSGADTNLALEEIEEYRRLSEDFDIYLDITTGKYAKWTSDL